MADKNTIKNWFRTGLKPTQAQFWATWDSFWHKDEKIPITAINDIENILADKADAEVLTNHLTNATAHADLFAAKEDKNKRGVALGYAPLDQFTKLATDYLNVVNDLVTGGVTSLLTAEQGKLLQIQITAINTLLTSNDINLDTVQEIVTAIKTVQTSLSTILVNDLTTGGTTKALTAEMGKTLKGLIDGIGSVAVSSTINEVDINSVSSVHALAPFITPTYDGSGQATHPSVVHIEDGWNGYKYWMAFTPYANENVIYENPSIICSNDKINWVVPTGLVNPIEPAPTDGTYLADTELVLGYDNKMYCYFRAFFETTAYMMVKSSTDGISWSNKITACTETASGGQGLIAPAIIKENNGYTLYEIEGYGGQRKIYKRFTLNPENFNGVPRVLCTYEGIPIGFTPWHLWVVFVKGVKYVMLNTIDVTGTNQGGDLLFGLIEDNHLKFNSNPVLSPEVAWNTKQLYRSSMIVKEFTANGIVWDLFYSGVDVANQWRIGYTTVNSYYKDFVPDLIDEKNGNFTLSLNEIGKAVINNNKLNQIVSIPTNSMVDLPIGYSFKNIIRYPNRTSYVNAAGVSLFTPKNTVAKSHADGGVVILTKTDTNAWFLSGDLEIDNVISKFPTSGLIANWKLNETSGDVNDSWKGHNGINVGATRGAAGILGNCYSFNGTTSKVTFPSKTDFSFTNGRTDIPFTIRLLVKFNSNGNQVLMTKGGVQNREYIALYEEGSMTFRLNNGQSNTTVNIEIKYPITHTLGIWYEYVFGYNGSGLSSGLKMYLNGVSVGSTSPQGSYVRMFPGIADLELGKYEGLTSYSLNGFLDDISIWKGVLLDQSQINYLYNGGIPKELEIQ